MAPFREERLAVVLLWIAMLGFACITFATSLSYHHDLKSQAADTGVFYQMLYHFMHIGKPVTTLTIPFVEQSWLGVHSSFALLLFAPLTQLFDGFYFLNVISAASFAFAAFPIFLTCRFLHFSPLQSVGWASLYLINPFIINAAVIDFHENCLAAPLLSFALLYLLQKNARKMCLCLLLLLTVKEHYALAWIGFAFAWFGLHQERLFPAKLALSGALCLALLLLVILPYFAEGRDSIFFALPDDSRTCFGWILQLTESPEILLRAIINAILYMFVLLLPFLFLPLGAIAILFTSMADFAVNSLSSLAYFRDPSAYYSAPMIPTLVIASAIGAKKLLAKNSELSTRDLLLCVAAISIPYSISFSNLPLPYFKNGYQLDGFATPMTKENRESIRDIQALLAEDDVISATSFLAPWFATHRNIYWFPKRLDSANVIIFYTGKNYDDPTNAPGVAFSISPPTYFEAIKNIMTSPDWGVVYFKNDWLVLEKGVTGNVQLQSAVKDALAHQQQMYSKVIEKYSKSRK